jgi:hypothetical protein
MDKSFINMIIYASVMLPLVIIESLFIVLSYFTLHYFQLFVIILKYFALGYFQLF